MLAGGAPLHVERLTQRGGPAAAVADSRFFYDTSGYGERGLDAAIRVVGIDQLVFGSDRPMVDPPPPDLLGAAAGEAILRTNPGRVLRPAGSRVGAAA
jgi:hypothetical protein